MQSYLGIQYLCRWQGLWKSHKSIPFPLFSFRNQILILVQGDRKCVIIFIEFSIVIELKVHFWFYFIIWCRWFFSNISKQEAHDILFRGTCTVTETIFTNFACLLCRFTVCVNLLLDITAFFSTFWADLGQGQS